MTNYFKKISTVFIILILSLLMVSCSQGDRGFVPVVEEPEEEAPASITITGGAVKGPLVNAEINIYKFELDKGDIYHFNNAVSHWFELLKDNEVRFYDGQIELGNVSAQSAIQNIKDSFKEFGWVTGLTALKKEIKSTSSFSAAKTKVENFLTQETNAQVSEEVTKSLNTSATLSDLKRSINLLETLTEKLLKAETFSQASSIISSYKNSESDTDKQAGFDSVISKLNALVSASSRFGLSTIKNTFNSDVYDVYLDSLALQNDPIALVRLKNLKSTLDSASTVSDALTALRDKSREEGNSQLKSAYERIISKIVTINNFYSLVDGIETLLNNYGIKNAVLALNTTSDYESSLKELLSTISGLFSENSKIAFRKSLVIEDDSGNPVNRLSYGVTNGQGVLPGLEIGEYRGFVYLEALASDETIDLNTGTKPLFSKMESIFHTDDILGNGDNSKEDKTIYFMMDGEIQRDSEGKIITDSKLIDVKSPDGLLTVRPSFFASPLTHFSFNLALEKLSSFDYLQTDSNGDLNADFEISESLLKQALKNSSNVVRTTFGIGIPTSSLFTLAPMRLAEHQFLPQEDLSTIQYRLSIENYASFIKDLIDLTDLNETQLIPLLVKDLEDGQIDGQVFDDAITELAEIPQIQYLLKIHPSERFIPGTTTLVSNILFKMNEELSTTLPNIPSVNFQIKNSEVVFVSPAGGLDSDEDGTLDNEDQFPQDANKVRNLAVGYKGIWSLNYDNSETGYMPFKKNFELRFNVEEIEGNCQSTPCIGLGSLTSSIQASYKIISAPSNHDLVITPYTSSSQVGFDAFATVPGNYLLEASFTTSVAPIQTYKTYIPIHVINPRTIQIKFEPEKPEPGKVISVNFKATKALCELYQICNGIDLNDNIDDYLPISLLDDVYSIDQRVTRNNKSLAFTSVNSSISNQLSAQLSNIELKDFVELTVKFVAGSRSFSASTYSNIVGKDKDADNDGISDIDDLFPNDANCHLEKDGLLDSNLDGVINSLDEPYCFTSVIAQATKSISLSFLNEKWHYNPSWHFIIREKSYTSGFNGYISTPTLTGTKSAITSFKEDPVLKRIYIAYKNGAIDVFSQENQTLKTFSPSYSFNPVNSMHLLGSYLLVEYQKNGVTKLFNKNGSLADIKSDVPYPYPGNAINLKIDGLNINSATNSLFEISWIIERERSNDNTQVDQLGALTANQQQTLNSGQTVFGDVVKVNLNYKTSDNRVLSLNHNIFVIGAEDVNFPQRIFDDKQSISINFVNFNQLLMPSDNSSLFVEWSKNNIYTEGYTFTLRDREYPFILEEKNFEMGDLIRATLYIKHGLENLKITTLDAAILGNLDDFVPKLDTGNSSINPANRSVNVSIFKPYSNDKYYTESTFTPLWKINQQVIPNENSLNFPTSSSVKFSYGDLISVSFRYSINGFTGETDDLLVGAMAFNSDTSIFTLASQVVELGVDASLNLSEFTETELGTIEAIWKINGVIDPAVKSLSYPASKLSYGDSIELQLLPKNADSDRVFKHIAKGSVGINLESLLNNTDHPESDLDSDLDGIPNHRDYFRNDAQCSAKNDGIPDDIDGDGIADLDELFNSNPNKLDTDNDGLSDQKEVQEHGTNPKVADTDSDGYLDSVEVHLGTDPLDASSPGSSLIDNDFDGLSNELELSINTKVNVFDTDNDGLSDWYEIQDSINGISKAKTDPLNPDTDGDKLSDGVEVLVTYTEPLEFDSDSDGLHDGLEVSLKLNPNDDDTDKDGILDADENGYNFSMSIPNVLYLADLRNYRNNFSALKQIKQGTCFKTWLANNDSDLVKFTHENQLDQTSNQEVVFASSKWQHIVRYDADRKHFEKPIDILSLGKEANEDVDIFSFDAYITSLSYDLLDSSKLYIGFSDGWVRLYNSQQDKFTSLYKTDASLPITAIVNQQNILIAEQKNASDEIIHTIFDRVLASTPEIRSPKTSYISDVSYKNVAWDESSYLQLYVFDADFSSTGFMVQTLDTSNANPIASAQRIDLNYELTAPVYLEKLSSINVLHFGNGLSYRLNDSTISQRISPFSQAFSHQGHRVLGKKNTTMLEITTQTDLIDGQYWRLNTQLTNNKLLTIVPVGYHLLAISTKKPTNSISGDGKISFESIILGDESSDGLPDWWNRLSASGSSSNFNAFELSSDSTIPDYLDGTPNIDDSLTPPVLQDTDGDGICDHWELNLFNTNPLSADTDADGISDAQELSITSNIPVDCTIFPVFNLISDPLVYDSDGDGLSDGEEYFTYLTSPLSSDSDGDGLSDYQEVYITLTNPLESDSDNDGTSDGDANSDSDSLTDAQEINLYHTNHLTADSDLDGLNDDDEVLVYGTNPNDSDTDGDTLSDYDEVINYNTLANSIDSDIDGLSDPVELNINGDYEYSSNPMLVDTDGDGLTDFDEFEFVYDYTEEQLEELGNPKQKSNPMSIDSDGDGICDKWERLHFNTNPAESDTDGDRLSDYIELGLASVLDCSIIPASLPISSPLVQDSDADRILDGDEVLILGTDPRDKDSNDNRINDDLEDPDQDGLNNYQELYLTKTDPFNPDSDGDGINDANDDNDNDGLSNIDEINRYGTDPLNEDSDFDGISDKDEVDNADDYDLNPLETDTDDDGLSDAEELNIYQTNPTLRDTDRDGLDDYKEVRETNTDPNDPDTDHDFLLDGDDDAPRVADFDGDGIPDGIEVNYLKTDPANKDTDADGLNDNYEAWVFAFSIDLNTNTETNSFISTGILFDKPLNSHHGDGFNWPSPQKFNSNNRDRLVFDVTDVLDSTKIKARLYVHRYSNPASKDSDGDGLFDSSEFEIERVYGVEYRIQLGIDQFNPRALNSENFKVSDPWNRFTGFIKDSDGDGINDFYEEFYTLTNPNNADSDGDGITDDLENEDGDLLSDLQEVLYGSDPNISDVGLDSDGDGIPDVLETMLLQNYDINLSDSDGDGIPDGLEDEDQDRLTNLEEIRFKTDPLTKDFSTDSDGDGLSNYQEYYLTGTDPLLEDSDGNGILDGQEDPDNDSISNLEEMRLGGNPNAADDIANIVDTDNDGLSDFQELNMTFTNPTLSDTDGNGIGDAQEDTDSDGLNHFQEVHLGTNPTVFDSDLLQKDSDNDGLSNVYELKVTLTDPENDDTDGDGFIDGENDPDKDGLTDFVEIVLGTNKQSKNIAVDQDTDGLTDVQERLLTLTNPNSADSDNDGILDGEENPDRDPFSNLQEISNLTNPYAANLSDYLKDADGDYLVNGLDQLNDNQVRSVTNPDQDNDSIPDGIEALIFRTELLSSDSDNDGILDSSEIKSWSLREVSLTETCSDTEIRLPSVSGKHYCVSIEYYSYPTLVDSDNDGVPDRSIRPSDSAVILDHYPLDAACHLATDGFIKADLTTQCFGSWMAESEHIEMIKRAQWIDTSGSSTVDHADILFYDSGWNSIVVFNALTSTYSERVELKTEINSQAVSLVDFIFNEASKNIYLLYSDSSVESVNIQTRVVQSLGQYSVLDFMPESLVMVNDNRLIVSHVGDASFEYQLLNVSGTVLDSFQHPSLSLKNSLLICLDSGQDCSDNGSIFGFAGVQTGGYAQIGRLNLDLANDLFESDVILSVDPSNGELLKAPIRLASDKQTLQLGSGHLFDFALQDVGSKLTFQHLANVYSQFYDFNEYADHFVGIVDVDLVGLPDSADTSPMQNGIFITELDSIKDTLAGKLPGDDSINDLKSLNQYLLQPIRQDEKVLSLIPFAKTSSLEIAVIKRTNNRILVESLGLSDEDNDLMTGLYEKVFGLDDSDSSDKFDDLDMDGLSNIEEYFFATDPSNSDSDFDGWSDIEEILRGTQPNNPLSF